IEHGPVVPNVSLLLVESADYFDGIRLHRLRGHVTHGWWRGRCLLISNLEAPAEQRAAVELVLKETDGHRIAAAELRRLGIEATLGERPEEFMDFGWGDPGGDRDLMLRTRQEAVRLLTLDPGMKRRTHRPLLYLIRARLGEEIGAETNPAGAPAPAAGGGEGRRKRRRRR
ncbi:MAG TPA: hypothetical protein PKW90_24125, partial [Myxococcota bacterium]|nr:hypothetical protein [Myxococcota bacterium]